MKLFAIFLCFAIGISHFSNADDAAKDRVEDLKDKVTLLRRRAQDSVNYLKSYKTFLPSKLKGELQHIKSDSTAQLDSVMKQNSEHLKSLAETAKSEGKNATICLSVASEKCQALRKAVDDVLDNCEEVASRVIYGTLDEVNKGLINGIRLAVDLKLLFLNCPTGMTDVELGYCIDEQLPEANESVNNLEKRVKNIQALGDEEFNKSTAGATTCNSDSVGYFVATADSFKKEAESCLNSLPSTS